VTDEQVKTMLLLLLLMMMMVMPLLMLLMMVISMAATAVIMTIQQHLLNSSCAASSLSLCPFAISVFSLVLFNSHMIIFSVVFVYAAFRSARRQETHALVSRYIATRTFCSCPTAKSNPP
jgi:hypothetical protein